MTLRQKEETTMGSGLGWVVFMVTFHYLCDMLITLRSPKDLSEEKCHTLMRDTVTPTTTTTT